MHPNVFKSLMKLKRSFFTHFNIYHLILPFLFALALSIALLPVVSSEPPGASVMFENIVSSEFSKPGDEVIFTITYANNMSQTAYNVTIFEWMPPSLTFVNSKPFYDGTSDPDMGFYKWSRGDVLPYEVGSVVVKVLVNNVPVGTEITNTAHLAYELENGTRVEAAADAEITVLHAAGVDVYHDQIHSVAPHTGEWTEYNLTVENTGNGLDVFNILLRSIAYNPSGSTHEWEMKLYNSSGYLQKSPVVTLHDDNAGDRTSWTDHGVVSEVTLESGEATWLVVEAIEAAGTSGSGDAYLDVNLIATSLFDPSISDSADEMTIVKSAAGITLAPDYSRYANPGDMMVYRHILINSGQTEIIDINHTSPMGWDYTVSFDNGTALEDTDGSGCVDVGTLLKNDYVFILVKVPVPYGTPAATVDPAIITAQGVASGKFDTANDTTTVMSAPILNVNKKPISGNPAYQGDVITYQINITNLGNTKLVRIPLYDTFETSCLDFINAYPAQDAYDETAGTIHWENLTALEPRQSTMVTVNYMATASDDSVRQSANVIDAEDEFGNLVSTTCVNNDLKIVGAYTLTVTSHPSEAIGGSFTVTWTQRGVGKDGIFTTEKQITCDQDTTASINQAESPLVKEDIRYVFSYYSPAASIVMDSEKTASLHYRTEYSVTFEQVGSSEPIYITVDGTQLTDALPRSLWIPRDSVMTFSYPSPVADAIGTTRYVLIGISGNTTDSSVMISAPTTITGHYKTQYYLDVTTDPAGLDSPQHTGWYDEGTYAELTVETPTGGDGVSTRYRFDHWTGVGIVDEISPLAQILMDSPKQAIAHYVRQIKLTVSSDHDSPDPSVGEHWYDEGEAITVTVESPADESGGTRYRCSGWSGTGSIPKDGPSTSLTFSITAPSSIEWTWTTQHYLTVKTDPEGLDGPTGEGWYDEGTFAAISVDAPTGGDGVSTRYRFQSWSGEDLVEPDAKSTTVLITAPKVTKAVFVQQFYLTMSTNFGTLSPESGWYDAGSVISIKATAPTMTEGEGFVWHGWTGTGKGAYSGFDNPASVTMNSAISETAYWKVDPLLTVVISNETIASGHQIVVYGKTLPVESRAQVLVTYAFPNGTQIEHAVYTDEEGNYEDTLLLDQDYLYSLFVDDGEWVITARRLGGANHENSQASAKLEIEARPVTQFSPILMAGAIMVVGLVALIPPIKKVKNKKTWWRITLILSCAGLVLGVVSLALNWVLVAGTVTNNTGYDVDISLRPFQDGFVSITNGLQYIGDIMPSMVNLTWQNIIGSSGPVLTLYVAAVGYALAVVGVYKPKNMRQRRLKVAILVISGALVAATVVHTYIFVQGQANTIEGAGIGFGVGVYVAIISSALLVFSGLSATKDVHSENTDTQNVLSWRAS